jgi:C4-dicarboxylate-specific signal transduction histidine kinase
VDDDLPGISTDRHKVLQILVNFIGNAKQAMSGNSDSDRILKISVRFDGSDFHIHMRDNGSGIAKENLPKIFNHGFTTKADGHGFGLHSSALAARELGGSLSVQSDGEGLGATFSLRLPPCRPQDDRFDESLTADTDQSFTVVNG